ncbi:MAG TPA: hypothetical protein VKR54_01180 [Candidatus Babeliales bacterium]|jgi:hypothetical protein|nr:hypothetical protein [Candidatus Babeliales bacterium]
MKKTVQNIITRCTALLLISSYAVIHSMKLNTFSFSPERLELLLIKPNSIKASSGHDTNTITVYDKNRNDALHVEYTAKKYIPCSETYEYFRCGTFVNYISRLGPKKELNDTSIIKLYDPTAFGIKEFIIKANDFDKITVQKKNNKKALITIKNTMSEHPKQAIAAFYYRS